MCPVNILYGMGTLLLVALTIAALTVVLVAWTIFTPVRLVIHTQSLTFMLFQWPTFKVALKPGDAFRFEMSLFGIQIPLKRRSKKAQLAPTVRKHKHAARRKSFDSYRRLITGLRRSFRIKKCHINIDTGDVLLNAYLIPLFQPARHPFDLRINFTDVNSVDLSISLLPYKVVREIILFKLKN
jgi:hypothetical protein